MGRGHNYGDRRRDYGGERHDRYEPPTPSRQNYARPSAPRGGAETLARVKWFNPEKGFGFVELVDGSGEAFLHMRQVVRG